MKVPVTLLVTRRLTQERDHFSAEIVISIFTPFESMEHDGLSATFISPQAPRATSQGSSVQTISSTPTTSSGSVQLAGAQGVRGSTGTAPGGATSHPQGDGSATRRRSINAPGSGRTFCPVVGCPEVLTSSNRYFRDFSSIKIHLNDHCTGHLSGAVPADFLNFHNYYQCSVCDKILSRRYNGTYPSCRPRAQAQQQFNIMRSQVKPPNSNPPINQQSQPLRAPIVLPSLAEIHERFVPTIKNIPRLIRRLFAQCLTKSLAQAVWSNNHTSWTELQMLAKCTLCQPPCAGKSHVSQRLTVTW